MSQTEFYIYAAILTCLVFVLSIAVSFYYARYKRLLRNREKMIAEVKKNETERLNFVADSIITIARAYSQGQVEAAEACIRLRMLIDRYDFVANDSYPVIFKMYEEIKHFKTHEARKALSSQERFEEDKSRFRIEDEFHEAFKAECERLLEEIKL